MKKVYCKNCEFEHGDWDALAFLEKKLTGKEVKAHLNENHNCPYYRRKWWKFWVK